MPGLWRFVGDTVAETLGGAVIAPIVIGGVIVSLAASPELRRRARRWGVEGMAAAIAATDLATGRAKMAGSDAGGVVGQLGQRLVQAAAEAREEWDDFMAEARAVRAGTSKPAAAHSDGIGKGETSNGSRRAPRRRSSRVHRPAR